MMTEQSPGPGHPAFWSGRWREGRTTWDQGGAHPELIRLIADAREWNLLPDGSAILEPGAGRAHNGAALAGLGFHVTSFDGAAEAVDAARTLYGNTPHLTLAVADALVPVDAWRGQFQAIFDRAMLCAVAPDQRGAYLQTCFEHLRPGGIFMTLAFTEIRLDRPGPPFAIPMQELAHLLTAGFALVTAREFPNHEPDGRIVREMAAIWRRRSRHLVES